MTSSMIEDPLFWFWAMFVTLCAWLLWNIPWRAMAWNALAQFLSRPKVFEWLMVRASKTPYTHITGVDGSLYMARFWLFNRYDREDKKYGAKYPFLPSIRIHHIHRPDDDRDLHDHPWDARTIILHGSYNEEFFVDDAKTKKSIRFVPQGSTHTIKFGQYHRITQVSLRGTVTLFITWKYCGTWGFWRDGKKIPHYEYLKK